MLRRAAYISECSLSTFGVGVLQKVGFIPISLLRTLLSLQWQPPSFEVLFSPNWVSQK